MSDSDKSLKHNPFEPLKELLKEKAVFCPVSPKKPKVSTQKQVIESAEAYAITDNEESR